VVRVVVADRHHFGTLARFARLDSAFINSAIPAQAVTYQRVQVPRHFVLFPCADLVHAFPVGLDVLAKDVLHRHHVLMPAVRDKFSRWQLLQCIPEVGAGVVVSVMGLLLLAVLPGHGLR